MRTLIILNENDIRRLSEDKHVPLLMRNRETGERSTIVIVSDKCYDTYMRGEYDIEKEEIARRSTADNITVTDSTAGILS